jgi:hypothetical protein
MSRERSWLIVVQETRGSDGFRMETPIEANISITPLANKRTAYCEQQAAECALVATTAILPEIREAYLNIERAWLHLAPEMDSSRSFLSASKVPLPSS